MSVERVQVKICGVLDPANAAMVASAGADFVGLNFWPRSRRYLAPERAAEVAAAVRAAGSRVVGLFVNATTEEILALHAHAGLDVVQLHGDEAPEHVAEVARALAIPVWKAVPLVDDRSVAELERFAAAAALLVDAPSAGRGGSGVRLEPELAAQARRRIAPTPLILAGGLTPATVAAAIAAVQPWAVDAASGVESAPGVKDPALVRAFLEACAAASR